MAQEWIGRSELVAAGVRTGMRNVIVSTYMTLDGKVDGVRDWAVPFDDPGAVKFHTDLMANCDGLLLGRKTYELFAALWPPRAGTFPYVDQYNRMAKYVASTTLSEVEWENSRLIEGDVATAVAELKQQPGQDLVLYGCHQLMHTLMEHDLIDEYRLLVQPVLLGTGRSFLDEGAARVNLELVDTSVTASGGAVLTYRPAR